jgi:PAS domain S-box-containing protein
MIPESRLKVLILDDSPEDREIYHRFLREEMYEFFECEMGEEGIRICLSERPDCVLVDYNLPDMTGLEFVEQLRKSFSVDQIALLFLTGQGNEEIAVRAMKMQVQDYLIKGNITAESLRVSVRNALEKVELLRKVEVQRKELVSTNESLSRINAILEAVVEGNIDAIFLKDLDGRYLMINHAGAEIMGRDVYEIIGRSDSEIFAPEIAQKIAKDDLRLISGGKVRTFEQVLEVEKKKRTFLTTKMLLNNIDGKVIGLLGIQRDITALKEAEAERSELMREQIARKEAEHANKLKDEFLAMVSHELRTPLTSMLGWSAILRSGNWDQNILPKAIESIDRNARAQVKLVNDLLEVSTFLIGKDKLNLRSCSLSEIIDSAVDTLTPSANARNIMITRQNLSDDALVNGDPVRLHQALVNIISNAIKYSKEGDGVEIKLEKDDNESRIGIKDKGIGINKEILPHIFDRFTQADTSITRKFGGLGLGLSIALHIVELHGGTIHAESMGEGYGSTFTVVLPLLKGRVEENESSQRYLSEEHYTN